VSIPFEKTHFRIGLRPHPHGLFLRQNEEINHYQKISIPFNAFLNVLNFF